MEAGTLLLLGGSRIRDVDGNRKVRVGERRSEAKACVGVQPRSNRASPDALESNGDNNGHDAPPCFWSARQWRSRLARARRGKDDNNNTNNTNNTNNRIGPPKSWVASASRPKHSTKHYPARQWPGLEYEKRCEIRRHFGTISAAKNRRCGDSSLTLCMVVLQRQWSHHPIVKTHTEENMSSKKWRENKKSFEKQMERGTTRGPRLAAARTNEGIRAVSTRGDFL
jgi:hypothetical protein